MVENQDFLPKIGKMYQTIEMPCGNILAWLKDPFTFFPINGRATAAALFSPIPSKVLVMVVEEGMAFKETGEVDYLYWKVIYGENFYWIHPYDLVEVDGDGTPIVPKNT